MPEEKRNTVMVGCTVPNGIALRLFKEGHDDGSGVRHQVQDGPDVTVGGPSAGFTEVDEEWFNAWRTQNENNPLLTGKQVYLIEPEGEQERHDGY